MWLSRFGLGWGQRSDVIKEGIPGNKFPVLSYPCMLPNSWYSTLLPSPPPQLLRDNLAILRP